MQDIPKKILISISLIFTVVVACFIIFGLFSLNHQSVAQAQTTSPIYHWGVTPPPFPNYILSHTATITQNGSLEQLVIRATFTCYWCTGPTPSGANDGPGQIVHQGALVGSDFITYGGCGPHWPINFTFDCVDYVFPSGWNGGIITTINTATMVRNEANGTWDYTMTYPDISSWPNGTYWDSIEYHGALLTGGCSPSGCIPPVFDYDDIPVVINHVYTPAGVTATTDLAIYDTPNTSLLINGASSASISVGQSAMLSWTPTATNNGNSCRATDSWGGDKPGTSGSTYTESTGAMNTPGVYTYTLSCLGGPPANPVSSSPVSVTLNVGAVPDFPLTCTPPSDIIFVGSSTSYNLSTTPENGFNSPVTFTPSGITPTPGTPPTINFVNNGQVPSATTTAVITTTSSTSTGTYTLSFSGTGGGQTHSCNVQLIINPVPPVIPNPPTISVDNSTCGTVTVNWIPGATPPPFTNFKVYRASSSSGPWSESNAISPLLESSERSFADPSPSTSGYWYMVRAFNSSSPSINSNVELGTLQPCIPNLSNSDKDLYRVDNNTSGSSALRCNGQSDVFTLASGGIFKTGSTVYFNINICNTGFAPITGVTVTEIDPHNLDELKLIGTTGGSLCTASGIGTQGPYSVSDVAPNTECTLRISAKLRAPVSDSSFLYRFWNTALITTNEDNLLVPRGPTRVTTPPYLFSDTGKPTRNETSP